MKKLFPILACSLAFGLFACSDDDDSSSSSDTDTSTDTNSGTVTGGTAIADGLASTADASVPASLYTSWYSYHFSTYETETAAFPTLAEDWDDQYIYYYNLGTPAGRVVWSTSSTSKCKIAEASGTDYSAFTKRGCTVSEGIGYGMLIAAMQGEWDAFNRLYIYNKAQYESMNFPSTGLMSWETISFSYDNVSSASATDADLDIAASLIIAYFKTGSEEYLNHAKIILNAIWDYEINQSTYLIYSGDDASTWQGSNPAYNLSYFSPVAIRLFALVDGSHDWQSVLDQSYAYMLAVQANGTGVFPDWSDATGTPINPDNGSADDTYWTYNKEAVRIPWRIAWDYLWYSDERALQVLTTLNNFAVEKSGGDPASMPAVYYSWYAGNETYPDVENSSSTLAKQYFAAWCATGIGTNSAWLESCTSLFNANYSMTNNGSSYYPDILHLLYSQLLNGKFVKPY